MHNVVRHYKRYDVWQLAHELVLETYRLTDTLPSHEKYGLTAQSLDFNSFQHCGRCGPRQ